MPEERDHKDIGAPRAAAAQPSLAYPVARHMGIASGESPLLLNFSAVLNIYVGIMMVPHAAKIAVQFVQEGVAPSFEHYGPVWQGSTDSSKTGFVRSPAKRCFTRGSGSGMLLEPRVSAH